MSTPVSYRARTAVAVLLFMLLAPSVPAQPAPGPLSALDPLIGKWQGTQEGQPGTGTVEREYSRILRSRFIQMTNRSVYPAQEKNPKGEEHEDIGIFSNDGGRKRITFRQYHVEGFVVQYVMEPVEKTGTLVFVSESIANIPDGYRARETYHLIGADEFEEVFELAEPAKDFSIYSRSRLKRVR